ncbi:MAG TPA: ABC transporter ATP-binding protein [Alkalispirochaeta sp.]|nr:ABC transporter ATP-binding protein [Alkalispirochaeta sp.]
MAIEPTSTKDAAPVPELELRNVSFSYHTATGKISAVESLSLSISRGDFLSIVGPSGCGKSTILRLIAGFLQPTDGVVLDEGTPVRAADWRRGLVFQHPELFPWLTVEGNVEFGVRMRGVPAAERRDRVEAYLKLVRLEDFRHKRPYELSGGMQQRVALARALVNEPHLLLLDEPFGALDALTREHLQDELRRIHQESGSTMVLVTHSVEEAVYLSSRCIAITPRPAQIRAEIPIDLSGIRSDSGREIKACPEFVALREQIMDHIWQ